MTIKNKKMTIMGEKSNSTPSTVNSTGGQFHLIKQMYEEGLRLVHLKGKRPITEGWQDKGIDYDPICHALLENGNYGIGVVCGVPLYLNDECPSVFCLDVDTKNNAEGIKIIQAEIEKEMPHLMPYFLLETTPSGGLHIFFLTSARSVNKTQKLAVKNGESKAWLETRGVGGQFRSFITGAGYALVDWQLRPTTWQGFPKKANIPDMDTSTGQKNNIHDLLVVSEEEFSALIELCLGLDERKNADDQPKRPVIVERKMSNFSKNPFDGFNESNDICDILETLGWQKHSSRGVWQRMTRPGKEKREGCSGSIQVQLNAFYCFSSSVPELENGKWYTPSTLVGIYQYNRDYKAMFNDIKDSYGKLTERASGIERRAYLNRYLSGQEAGLPPTNLCDDDLMLIENQVSRIEGDGEESVWPYGHFWSYEKRSNGNTDAIVVDRVKLYEVLHHMGYRKNAVGLPCKLVTNPHCEDIGRRFVVPANIIDVRSELLAYTMETEGTDIRNAIDKFIQSNGEHCLNVLEPLDESLFVKDSRDMWVRFFRNGIVKVTAHGASMLGYSELPEDKLIRYDYYYNWDYDPIEDGTKYKGKFRQFIEKACCDPSWAMSCFCYLAHDSKNSIASYLVGLLEKSGSTAGGAGKNLFMSMVGLVTPVLHKNAVQINKLDASFLNTWLSAGREARVISLDDTPEGFRLDHLKEYITGSADADAKYVRVVHVDFQSMPKITFNSNYSYSIKDGALQRRVRVVEFTPFFNKDYTVASWLAQEAGSSNIVDFLMPNENPHILDARLEAIKTEKNCWNKDDWNDFYTTVISNMRIYFAAGLVLEEPILSDEGKHKRMVSTFGQNVTDYVTENYQWLCDNIRSQSEFVSRYTEWCDSNNIQQRYQSSLKTITDAFAQLAGDRGDVLATNLQLGMQKAKRILVKGVKHGSEGEVKDSDHKSLDLEMPF